MADRFDEHAEKIIDVYSRKYFQDDGVKEVAAYLRAEFGKEKPVITDCEGCKYDHHNIKCTPCDMFYSGYQRSKQNE